jgi:hypothetical protein
VRIQPGENLVITLDERRIRRVKRKFTDKETDKEIERGMGQCTVILPVGREKTIDFYKNQRYNLGISQRRVRVVLQGEGKQTKQELCQY